MFQLSLTKIGINLEIYEIITRENKMAEISAEEANLLLRLPNFRLPSDEEKEVYYNSQED
mgnify:CR=1 FL=1